MHTILVFLFSLCFRRRARACVYVPARHCQCPRYTSYWFRRVHTVSTWAFFSRVKTCYVFYRLAVSERDPSFFRTLAEKWETCARPEVKKRKTTLFCASCRSPPLSPLNTVTGHSGKEIAKYSVRVSPRNALFKRVSCTFKRFGNYFILYILVYIYMSYENG